MSNNSKDDAFFFLGLFCYKDYSSYFLASKSAANEHSVNKNRCSTACQYLSPLSLASVLEEEIISVGFFFLLIDDL